MEIFAISGLLNACAAIGLAAFVYFRSPKDPRHWTFGLVGISTAVWSLSYFAWQISSTEDFALLFLKTLMAGAIFIPITFFHHVAYLLRVDERQAGFIKANYYIGAIFLVLDCTPYFVKGVYEISIFPFWGVPGWAFHICLIWWFGVVLYTHVFLLRAYLSEVGNRRRQLRNIMVGSGIGFLGGATNFPLWYGIEILPYGTIGLTIYISLVAYALLRFHWLDFSIYVEKGLSYFTLLLLISQPAYPVLLLAQKSVFGAINVRFSIVQLVVHFLTVAGAYQMKIGTRGAVARTVLKGRELKIQTLARFSSTLAHFHDISDLGKNILETLAKGMGASKGAIFIFKPEESRYHALSTFGFSPDQPIYQIQNGWSISDDLPQLLLFTQCRLSVQDFRKTSSDDWEKKVSRELEDIGLELCCPIFSHNQLLGFLVFGPGSQQALMMFGGKIVWNAMIQEATMVLENSLLREEVKRSQGLLCQVDRLRSLEAMANGLTQELHNPLVTIKTFVQMAELRRQDGMFMDSLHRVVGEDLAKIEQLTHEIKEYVKPLNESLTVNTNIEVHEVIDSCLLFISSNPLYGNILIEKNFELPAPLICMDRQELMQVIFNGLLFLLKDESKFTSTLQIETQSDSKNLGQDWIYVNLRWKPQSSSSKVQLIALGAEDFEDSLTEAYDPSAIEGLVVASQIIQRHFGCIQCWTHDDSILGFQIQLRVNPAKENEYLSQFFQTATLSYEQGKDRS